jgi:hypothetical protein
MRTFLTIALVTTLAAVSTRPVHGQDKSAYEQQSIARYLETFARLDMDRNDAVSRLEADGNLEFTATFDDMDINRDGTVTRAELERYLALRFGFQGGQWVR